MRTYYIEELKRDTTYIDFRLLLELDCDLKFKKISEILFFLRENNFIINLTTLNPHLSSEYVYEAEDIMSLSIDFQNDKMRFKFWNGASTLWLYHLSDLYDALETGRNEFSDIYDKYEPITEIFLSFKRKWSTSIVHISYHYFPNDDTDLTYHIVFTEEVKNTDYANKIINKINKEIEMLGADITKDLNFTIEHSFKTSGCLPCQKEREKNDEKNKE